jgi:hypothetical protein
MPSDLTETTVIRLADLMISRMEQKQACMHEGEIAVLIEADKRAAELRAEDLERHNRLQAVVDELGRAQVKTEEVVRQLCAGSLDLQRSVKQHDLDLAKNAGGKRAALVIASLISGFVGSLGGIVSVLVFMRGLFTRA